MKNVWEKPANKSSRKLHSQWTLFLSHISPSNLINVRLPHLLSAKTIVFILFFYPKKVQVKKGENNLISFCQNFGTVGLCRNAPTVESSHTPVLWRVTSRGMFHTLPKYLSWQQQKIFRDLSPGTAASVSQLQFSRLCVSALISISYQRAYHTCVSI